MEIQSKQWQQGYPNVESMKKDILNHNLFGVYLNNELKKYIKKVKIEAIIKSIVYGLICAFGIFIFLNLKYGNESKTSAIIAMSPMLNIHIL